MKTVHKIDPEKEYAEAKVLIELASQQVLDKQSASSLDQSVDNLITAARILMEREERRRGKPQEPIQNSAKGRQKGDERAEVKRLPSQRYLDLEIVESEVKPDVNPVCPCCAAVMRESGLFDISEKLEVKPKVYFISRMKRPKFNCGKCNGAMVNTPAAPSIVPTSNYGDSMIIDVALSKYCDIIPIDRYVQMAFRQGVVDLPPQSLIGLTHHLASFLTPVYELIQKEVQAAHVLMADETTWKMLEGDDTKQWYLWGFFSKVACYFEAHNTRSGDVAIKFLEASHAKYLMSDGYAGYSKAISEFKRRGRIIFETHCNAHAYRYFEEASHPWKEECKPYLQWYGQIYELERKGAPRGELLPIFELIKNACEMNQGSAMPGSAFGKAIGYFLNHFEGLIQCTKNKDIPLDNNLAERSIRSPVVGRKTWYGNHSKRGAYTTAILFSIVQSCKLNNINPRKYFDWVVQQIHQGKPPSTPFQYLHLPG